MGETEVSLGWFAPHLQRKFTYILNPEKRQRVEWLFGNDEYDLP